MSEDLPFRQIDGYPAQVNGPSVMARLLDGLGFRFYWATEGLTQDEYAFSPGQGCQSIGELVGHVWGLTNWVYMSVFGQGERRPPEIPQQREHALTMLHRLREHIASLDDATLGALTIDGHPFWHMLNGPIADALTHVGQINSFRRLAGNPTPKAGLFTGEPPGEVVGWLGGWVVWWVGGWVVGWVAVGARFSRPWREPGSLPIFQTKESAMDNEYPILEYDDAREAIIEPSHVCKPLDGMPEHCVICFFQNVIEQLVEKGLAVEISSHPTEQGARRFYALDCGLDRPGALLHPGIGAAIAAASLEVAIALGGRRFVACGGAGVLDRDIAVGHLVVPTSAVRDEGTSYHYLPAGREVAPAPGAVQAIETVLQRHKVDYLLAKTWTTDAIFRETRAVTALRRAEGCLTVEMEAAAFFAVAQFRNVPFGQILYGGDNLDADQWERRNWMDRASVREQLVFLAAEACLEMG